MRKTKAANGHDWVNNLEQAPRADIPDVSARAKRARRIHRYVTFAVIATPILVGLLFVSFLNSLMNTGEPGNTTSVSPSSAQARAVALSTINGWLAHDPSPLPGAKVVSWLDVSATNDVKVDDKARAELDPTLEKPRIEVHDVALSGPAGMYKASVPILIDPTLGVLATAEPSLTPYAPAANAAPEALLAGPSVSASESVSTAVKKWAEAFAANDPAALRVTVGDPDATHFYMPLVGAALVEAKVMGATVQSDLIDADGKIPEAPERIVARVQLTLAWSYQGETKDAKTIGSRLPMSYDVLIDRASSASPVVVAWGGAGTGPGLKAYANAIIGRELVTGDPNLAAPTPSATPSAAPTPTPTPSRAPEAVEEGD